MLPLSLEDSVILLNLSDVMLHPTHTIGQDQVRLSFSHPIQIQKLHLFREILPHDHAFFEMCLVTKGTVEHETSQGSHSVKAGFMAIVPVGAVHAFRQPKGCHVVNLYYLADWLLGEIGSLWSEEDIMRVFYGSHLFQGLNFRHIAQYQLSAAGLKSIQHAVDDLARELSRAHPSPLYLRSGLLKLQFDVLRHSRGASAGKFDTEHKFVLRPQLRLTLSKIEEIVAAGKILEMHALAIGIGSSPDYLNRLFRRELGLSVRSYFQRRRIQLACSMLLNPECTIKATAHALGFCDVMHFHRSFRKVMGLTPSKYRIQVTRESSNPVPR